MKTIRQNFSTLTQPTEGLRPTAAQPNTATNPWLYGTVRSVEPSREMLFLHLPQEDNDRIIHWLPQTRFQCRGATVKPGALHDGQQISVQYDSDAGQMFAKEIDIVVEPPVAESTAALRQSLWPSRSGRKARK